MIGRKVKVYWFDGHVTEELIVGEEEHVYVLEEKRKNKAFTAPKHLCEVILPAVDKSNLMRKFDLAAEEIISRSDVCRLENYTLSSHIKDDLRMDSLDIIEFVMNLEKSLNIAILDKEIEQCNYMMDFYNLVICKIPKYQL